MRQLFSLWMVICCCGFAAAQTDQALRSIYAEPFAPRLATPAAPPESLATPSRPLDPPHVAAPDPGRRFSIEHKLVAQLSQNMNFVMDLTVEEFITMHAESRQPASQR